MQQMSNGNSTPRMSMIPEDEVDDASRSIRSMSLKSRTSTLYEEIPEEILVRSADHYHEDGNIILIAGHVKFKVYSGLLSRRSEIFGDLFSIPQPDMKSGSRRNSQMQQIVDGVPAITLSDDPNDLTHLLDLVLPIASPYKPFESPSFDSLSATLILSTKYCFDDLREWAMACILHRFPHTLEEVAAHPNLSVYKDPSVSARLITLGREADLPQLLPMAFYALAAVNWEGLDQFQKAVEHLSLPDQARIGVGRLRMQEAVLQQAAKMPENGMMGKECDETTANGGRCLIDRPSDIWGNMVERLQSLVRDPIREYGVRLASKGQYYNLCSGCDAAVVAGSESARKELFEMLPRFFQLA